MRQDPVLPAAAARRLAAAMLLLVLALPAGPALAGPLRVYVLAGQSNMQGHAHVRTLDAMRLDADTAELHGLVVDERGEPRTSVRTWVSVAADRGSARSGPLTVGFGAEAGGPKIGPELTFGLHLEERTDGPILLVKTAWGGRSLHTDFRPPSAGPRPLTEGERRRMAEGGTTPADARAALDRRTGRSYRRMIDHVRNVLADPGAFHPAYDPAAGVELAGFVWFQGWNDMVDATVYPERGRPGGYDAYTELLATLVADVRRDLAAPAMPVVIGVMGVGGPLESYPPDRQRFVPIHRGFRGAMAAVAARPELEGVTAVRTAPLWDVEVDALRAREAALAPRREELEAAVRAGRMDADAAAAARASLMAERFDERERALLRESTSDRAYHYLGSARILGRIGRAFAEALVPDRKDPA